MAKKKAFVNEQTVEIEVGGIAGTVKIPLSLTPQQYAKWWSTLNLQIEQEDSGSDIAPAMAVYQRRAHLFIEIDHPFIDEDGVPFPELAWALVDATDGIMKAATQRPTSPDPSANGANGKQSENATET